ncbi:thiamine pyrophosphate-dependent enzyme [Bradyrhizobium sp. BWA-3-5]|uniref:alpha-ketoacid dehydrogenase subunit alpha/beta n=1 Tax=Bradyrhizobium sp. BWA-3-5 TaxID=3080013 RepID=UPI00293F62D9|nr:thiamine pyrophosphate-dependent enzyme [Bradyrhizobium sp. BWA-3-5]WOH63939.1 thiamine pyrophosphate-dependent enzyme [Bradyrhizobium sp. BWA-3-5]
MPKEIYIDPNEFKARSALSAPQIPIHAYEANIEAERASFSDAGLLRLLRDMIIIREFETMVGSLKSIGSYNGVEFNYKGAAHLSIGQEAAAVGAAASLEPHDHIFGSHRSHGEFIAKGLSAIRKLPPEAARAIMENHERGALLRTVERQLQGTETAENFLLLGFLAEIFMRSTGFNRGMGGSMHAFFLPFGIYPNNAIVGASAGIATGAALQKKLARTGGIAVANAGDGSTGCGPVWEAMNFAAMAQFDTLWTDAVKGGLPVLFFFSNNFYAMGSQPMGETTGLDRLSRIGLGVNPQAMHAETVDGTSPLAVADAVRRKRELLVQGKGPALLDVEWYRSSGHSMFDANVYRTKEEMRAWEAHDPILLFSDRLQSAGIVRPDQIVAIRQEVASQMRSIAAVAVDPLLTPPVNIQADPLLIGKLMFSNSEIELPAENAPLLKPLQAVSRVQQDAKKSRHGIADDGTKLSAMRAITLRDALFESILHHITHDERLIAYGEDCRDFGSAFGVYRGLAEILPRHRLFNSPISEAAIVATAVGYAMEGGRALIELMFGDFLGRAGDEVFNQMAKWQSMSGGEVKLPVVLRCSVGSTYGAQHSQDWTALCAHIPGLKILYPATPYDAKGLLASALSSNDPVVFFESQRLYETVEQFRPEGVPTEYYRIPIGEPNCKRSGDDVTILTIGPSLYAAVAAADELEKTFKISAEVIDARSIVPFNYAPVLASVKKTRRILLVSEASERGSFLMTLAANITRFGYRDLVAAPRVLGSPNWIVPGGEMEITYFPQAHDIIDVVTGELFPDRRSNRRGVRNWDDQELARIGL